MCGDQVLKGLRKRMHCVDTQSTLNFQLVGDFALIYHSLFQSLSTFRIFFLLYYLPHLYHKVHLILKNCPRTRIKRLLT